MARPLLRGGNHPEPSESATPKLAPATPRTTPITSTAAYEPTRRYPPAKTGHRSDLLPAAHRSAPAAIAGTQTATRRDDARSASSLARTTAAERASADAAARATRSSPNAIAKHRPDATAPAGSTPSS